MKAYVINVQTAKELQEKINIWLEAFPNNIIMYVSQSGGGYAPVIYTILYKE